MFAYLDASGERTLCRWRETVSMTATHSAVIVPIPAAEQVVMRWRTELDGSARWGVPAHVTVVYPFLSPEAITSETIADLAAAVAEVASFEVTFGRCAWFIDDHVLWLAPDPDGPFRALTEAVWRRFPDYPPYDGVFADVVPHLTIGYDGSLGRLRQAEQAITPQLPIRTRITHASLICGSHAADSWRTVAEIPLSLGSTQ
jgi:2'-5' RNA ligase